MRSRRGSPRTDPPPFFRSVEAFEQSIFGVERALFAAIPPPSVLYHYTTWGGGENILRTRQFWATSHRMTNDQYELRAADGVVLEAASRLRRGSSVEGQRLFAKFAEMYPRTAATTLLDVYIACFSATRDSPLHWDDYSGDGSGICLGISMLNERLTGRAGGLPRLLVQIDYSESSWRKKIETGFQQIAGRFVRYVREPSSDEEKNRAFRSALSSLSSVAGLADIASKRPHYADESEWRIAGFAREGRAEDVKRRPGRDGDIDYVEFWARDDGSPIVLSELIIGPSNAPDAEQRAREMLIRVGYGAAGLPMPAIVRSASAL